MSTPAQTTAQLIAIARLKPSSTEAQTERRRHFDKAAIAELAESIKTVGLLSPIIARPLTDGPGTNGFGYEIVAGERRFMAAKAAGLAEIEVCVRELTDEQVLEVQLVENLQREGLHELAEAEGYEALQKLGHAAQEIADKVGKSKAYVYARMKLLALAKPARTAFYEGKISASIALLLARIPVEALQLEALEGITEDRYGNGPLSFREATELVRDEYMTALGGAGFPTEDAGLVPAAGACGACPKRTGNQRELFADVKAADVCTDPVCFKAKREAHATRTIAAARADGRRVITGKEAKAIMPHSRGSLQAGYAQLDHRPYQDGKNRTWRQILGESYTPALLQDPETGAVVEVAEPVAVKEALTKMGVRSPGSAAGPSPQNDAQKKAKLEKRWRAAVYEAMRPKLPAHLGTEDLRTIALRFYQEMQQDTKKIVVELLGLEPKKRRYSTDYDAPVAAALSGYSDEELARFFFDLVFSRELQVHTWSSSKPTLLVNTARKLKIDPEKIRKDLQAVAKPKGKPKAPEPREKKR